MGWPNWIRSRAWARASSSMAREAPTSSWASGQLGQGHGRGHHRRPAGPVPRGGRPSPVTSIRPSAGRRPGPPGGSGRRWPPRRPEVRPRSRPPPRPWWCRPGGRSHAGDQRARRRPSVPGGPGPAEGGQDDAGGRADAQPRVRSRSRCRGPRSAVLAVPSCSNRVATAVRRSIGQGLGPAEFVEGAVEGGAAWPTRRRARGSPRTAPAPRRPSPVGSRGRAVGGR